MATYVLLHGAYQGGWIWQRVTPHLRAAGHTVFAPTLDGCAERRHALRPGIDTESQAAEISEMLFFEDLHDIVLVGTSSGGMVAARVAETARERIGRIVFADALALFDGETNRRSCEAADGGHHGSRHRTVPGGRRQPDVRLAGPGDQGMGARPLYAAPRRGDGGSGKAEQLLATVLERLGDLVPAERQPAGRPPEADG